MAALSAGGALRMAAPVVVGHRRQEQRHQFASSAACRREQSA